MSQVDGSRWKGRRGLPLDRFFRHVQPSGECWEWTGARDVRGYGRFQAGGHRSVLSHRWLYEQMVSEIPDGLQLDHLCRNPWCVNVFEHLEPVPPVVNTRRADDHHANKTQCPKGHDYDSANTLARAGRRYCRACIATRTPHPDRHGTSSNYTYGCRCPLCREAKTASQAAYRARLKAVA